MSAEGILSYVNYFAYVLINILIFAIIARSLMSWFNPSPENPIVRFIIDVTEPILAPLRRIVPRIGMIDITPIVAIILLNLALYLFR